MAGWNANITVEVRNVEIINHKTVKSRKVNMEILPWKWGN